MGEYLTEDEVRETAGKILGFTKLENGQLLRGWTKWNFVRFKIKQFDYFRPLKCPKQANFTE